MLRRMKKEQVLLLTARECRENKLPRHSISFLSRGFIRFAGISLSSAGIHSRFAGIYSRLRGYFTLNYMIAYTCVEKRAAIRDSSPLSLLYGNL